jgi:DegV family protein with EDD domain
MPVRIVTDSTCDLPPERIADHKISVVPLYINFGDQSYLDGVELSRDAFYARLPSTNPPPTTSAPGTDAFLEVYRRLIAEGASGILSIHVGSALSNTFSVAQMASKEVTEVPLRVLDGGQISLGTGFLVVHAARLAALGASLDEITASVEALAVRTHAFAALDTLEYLRRGGRASLILFSVGSMLKVKPLLIMHAGRVVAGRARTSRGAIDRLIQMALDLGPLEGVALVHATAPDRLEMLRQVVQSNLPGTPIHMVGDVTPVIGAHVGPGAVGLICLQAPGPRPQGS